MSGIVGAFSREGEALDPALGPAMLERIAHRGPDGRASWARGPVALGHAMLHATPQSLHERQPSWDAATGLALVMDGHIDNRDEIVAATGLDAEATDIDLLAASYRRWGLRAAARLVGDFAFVLWDSEAGRLFCARDALGRKPLFYASVGARLLLASEPHALLADGRLGARCNEAMVAEYLTIGPHTPGETLLEGVMRLPPGHVLVADARGVSLERYWSFDAHRELACRDDDEYAERFAEALRTAVSACLRTHGPAGVLLSGGIDSTAVLCMANGLRAPGLRAYAMAFPGTIGDETPYIESAVAATGVPTAIETAPAPGGDHFAARARATLDFPGYPNGDGVFAPLEERARRDGVRVMLTGHGGDEALAGSFYHHADFLRGLKLGRLARQLRAERRLLRGDRRLLPFAPADADIWRFGVLPLLPRPWPRDWSLVRALRGGYRPPPWVSGELCRRVDLERRMRAPRMRARDGSFARQHIARLLSYPWGLQETEVLERLSASRGVELRSPFLDRRLLELALALPEEQRWRGEETKYVLRRALRGSMPEPIRTRRTKAEFSHLVAGTLRLLTREGFWASMESARCGWVDAKGLEAAARAHEAHLAGGADTYLAHFWPLWMAAGVEIWLRALQARAGVASPGVAGALYDGGAYKEENSR